MKRRRRGRREKKRKKREVGSIFKSLMGVGDGSVAPIEKRQNLVRGLCSLLAVSSQ